jgi:ribosomal protein L16 Arg81 hydroxylase
MSLKKIALLDFQFWQSFSKNYWEKKPLVLKNVKSELLQMSDAVIFSLLVDYSNQCRKNKNADGFKFYINGLKTSESDVLQILPIKADKNLLGYHKRMNKMFTDYCLVCDELLQANTDYQSLLIDFTNSLYKSVGFPNRFSEMGLYLGNYRKTPFGVHVDSCGVFSFPVSGNKKFRLWTADYVKKNPALDRAFVYMKHKKNSLVMDLKPGDLAYWPSSAWHIAEGDGEFSATWSLGIWVDRPHKTVMTDLVSLIVGAQLSQSKRTKTVSGNLSGMTEFENLHTEYGQIIQLPKSHQQAIKLIQGLEAPELNQFFLHQWMQHVSKQGFKNSPKYYLKIRPKSKIKLRQLNSKILWLKDLTDKSKYHFSFAGVVFETTDSSQLLDLIKALNSGETCILSDYLVGKNQKNDLKALQKIATAGALV